MIDPDTRNWSLREIRPGAWECRFTILPSPTGQRRTISRTVRAATEAEAREVGRTTVLPELRSLHADSILPEGPDGHPRQAFGRTGPRMGVMGHLYALGSAQSFEPPITTYKIGWGSGVESRRQGLELTSIIPLVAVWSTPARFVEEGQLHALLDPMRQWGEVFDLAGVPHVPSFLDICVAKLRAGAATLEVTGG